MREINELIWHCTATPRGREVSRAEIDAWHKARGWRTCGYHKIVHLDGSVSEGRPIGQVGAHVAGRNHGTLGYVYVGGAHPTDPRLGTDTRTEAQKATMLRLTKEAVDRYGVTVVSGHRDYAAKACPSFDARAEYAHLLLSTPDGMPRIDPVSDTTALRSSRTLAGAAGATTGTLGAGAADMAQQIEPLAYVSGVIKFAFIVLTLVSIAAVAYARWDDAGRPVPWGRGK